MKKENIPDYIKDLIDGQESVEKCLDLLYQLQREQGPVLETVTVIMFEKPLLHSLLKVRLRHNPGFNMLFSLTMDYQKALISFLP